MALASGTSTAGNTVKPHSARITTLVCSDWISYPIGPPIQRINKVTRYTQAKLLTICGDTATVSLGTSLSKQRRIPPATYSKKLQEKKVSRITSESTKKPAKSSLSNRNISQCLSNLPSALVGGTGSKLTCSPMTSSLCGERKFPLLGTTTESSQRRTSAQQLELNFDVSVEHHATKPTTPPKDSPLNGKSKSLKSDL